MSERDDALPEMVWPCANYQAPTTCITAPSSKAGRCDYCAAQVAALPEIQLGAR